MRKFAQEQNQTRQKESITPTRFSKATSKPEHVVHAILYSQRTIGNRPVQRMLHTHNQSADVAMSTTAPRRFGHDFSRVPVHHTVPESVQTKPTVTAAEDKYEREADWVAERVTKSINSPSQGHVQRRVPKEKLIQMKPARLVNAATVDKGLDATIQQARGNGRMISGNAREPIEQALGVDFSRVRVHTDASSDSLNHYLNARAFTVGQDVFFKAGEYTPGSMRGHELIVHELTHVVQQNETAGQHIQHETDNEEDSRFKRVPPGPGAYTEDEYKEWQRLHPDSALSLGGPWEPKSLYARYTPEWFSSRGYFYSGSMYGGYRGARIEVWLSNEGKGKVFRVFRGPEPERRELSEEPKRVVPAEKSPKTKEEHAAIEELQFYAEEYMERKEYFVDRAAELRDLQGSPDYGERFDQLLDEINEFQNTFNYILGERIPELVGEIDPQDQQALLRMGEYIAVLEEFYTWKSKDIVDLFRDLPAPPTQ